MFFGPRRHPLATAFADYMPTELLPVAACGIGVIFQVPETDGVNP
jgi:hypothetical protein